MSRYRPSDNVIAALIKQESGGNNNAVSRVGARGLAQVMPATGRDPGYGITPLRDDSPEEQRRFAKDYLGEMVSRTGSLELGLAAYNAGLKNVQDARGIPKFKETQDYVKNITKTINEGDDTDLSQWEEKSAASDQEAEIDLSQWEEKPTEQTADHPQGDHGLIPSLPSPKKALMSTPYSAYKLLKGTREMISHPIDTLGAMGDVVRGESYKLVPQLQQLASPDTVDRSSKAATTLNNAIAARYGSGRALKNTLETDPIGASLDLMGAAGLARSALKGTSQAIRAARDLDAAQSARAAATPWGAQPVRASPSAIRATPGTLGSGGAAGTDLASIRQMEAENFGIRTKMTKGQRTRNAADLQFERETAKNNLDGGPIRERYDLHNREVKQRLEELPDELGGMEPSNRDAGIKIANTIKKVADTRYAEVDNAYKLARTQEWPTMPPIAMDKLVESFNTNRPSEGLAGLLPAAKSEMVRLGAATVDDAGKLVALPVDYGTTELLRQYIRASAGTDAQNMRFKGILTRALDESTAPYGGDLTKQARSLRRQYAVDFEEPKAIDKLLSTKPNSSDRTIEYENVLNHAVNGSRSGLERIIKTLEEGGEEGQQALRELRTQVAQRIADKALSSNATTSLGDTEVSSHQFNNIIKELDKDGKLDIILGSEMAQKYRDGAAFSKTVFTVPKGVVNESNTSSAAYNALDRVVGGIHPISRSVLRGTIGHIVNRQTRLKVAEHLK